MKNRHTEINRYGGFPLGVMFFVNFQNLPIFKKGYPRKNI